AAVVAHAFHDRYRAGIAHGEALACDAADVAFALGCAVEHRISGDDRIVRIRRAVGARLYDDAPTRQALADIVVGVTLERQRDAACEEGAEGLAGGALEVDLDRVWLQSLVAVALGDLTG